MTITSNIKRAVAASTAGLCVFAAAACGSEPSSAQGDATTLKVGVVVTNAGSFAEVSGDALAAAQVSADELNSDGHKYKIDVTELQTDGTAANTLQVVTRAAQTDGVRYITGFMTSDVTAAVQSRAPSLGVTVLDAVAQDTALVGKGCNKNFFQIGAVSSQYFKALGHHIADKGAKTWSTLASDYARGRDAVSSFKSVVQDAGGSVVNEQYAPLGTTDFGSQIAAYKRKPTDGLLLVIAGSDSIAFMKQADQFGLLKNYKVVVSQGLMEEPLLPSLGNPVIGINEIETWVTDTKGTASGSVVDFAKDYKAKTGHPAWFVPATVNVALDLLTQAADKAGSTDNDTVGNALSGMSADTIQGKITIRSEDHLALQPLSTIEAQRGPKLVTEKVWSPDDTTPAVSSDCHM